MMLLTQAPGKIDHTFTTPETNLILSTIVLHIVPNFVCFFLASYTLPMLSQLLMDYPTCFHKEIIDLRTHDDIEKVLNLKPTDVIRQQLNGKKLYLVLIKSLESLLPSDDANTTISSLTRQLSETESNLSVRHSRTNSSVWHSLRQE